MLQTTWDFLTSLERVKQTNKIETAISNIFFFLVIYGAVKFVKFRNYLSFESLNFNTIQSTYIFNKRS